MNCTEGHLNQDYGFWGILCPFKHRVKMFKKYTKHQKKGGSTTLYILWWAE